MPMRELTVDLFITLDGFARGEESPAYFGYLGPDLQRWIDDELARRQVVLMGRVTYETMAAISQAGDYDDANRMTDLPKVVFSRTLQEPLAWANTRLVSSDPAEAIHELKEEPGDLLRTIGSPSLVKSLLRLGLVDRLRLIVFPQILGATGLEPIFSDLPDLDLELIEANVLDSRLLAVEYRPGLRQR
jgi:dihydrofolate reductase